MKKVISQGYTITVTSWENDGDNYNTQSITVDDIERAKAIGEMCNAIFKSASNGGKGIGNLSNSSGGESKAKEIIIAFMEAHPILWESAEMPKDKKLVDICMDINYSLMGGSEYYYSRVMERCEITYSDDDIYLEEIHF